MNDCEKIKNCIFFSVRWIYPAVQCRFKTLFPGHRVLMFYHAPFMSYPDVQGTLLELLVEVLSLLFSVLAMLKGWHSMRLVWTHKVYSTLIKCRHKTYLVMFRK